MPIYFVKPLIIAIGYLLFATLAWRRLPWAVLFVVAALPSYLIRFRIGPIPATLLEGMLLIIIVAAIFHRIKKSARRLFQHKITNAARTALS